MFIWAIILESAFLLALAGAVLGLIHWKDRKKRLPFTQKILRPPGESLRLRLIELDEKLNDCFVQLFLAAYSPLVMAGLVAMQGVRPTAGVWITLVTIAVIASIWSAFRLWKLIKLRRRIRLGFEGERHVGETLNQLMLAGYRVFHDFLITDKPRWIRNIDHIVIGPNGVFAVETKTPRKVKGENGAKVTVLENALQYPWGIDQRDIEQAQDDAKWLSRMAFENVTPTGERWIDTCASRLVHRQARQAASNCAERQRSRCQHSEAEWNSDERERDSAARRDDRRPQS